MKFACTLISLGITFASFAQGELKACKNEAGRWGYCNAEGKVVIPQKYDDARLTFWENTYSFVIDGFVHGTNRKKWLIINTKGTVLCEGDAVGILSKDLIWQRYIHDDMLNTNTGKTEKIEIYRVLTPNKPKEYADKVYSIPLYVKPVLKNGAVFLYNEDYDAAKNKTFYTRGYLNEKGDWIIPMFGKKEGDWLDSEFSEGFVAFRKDGIAGYFNIKGETAIKIEGPADKVTLGPFSDGLALVKMDMGQNTKQYYFIDKEGKKAIDLGVLSSKTEDNKDVTVSPFRGGIAAIYKDQKWGFINTSGKMVIDFQFDDVKPRQFTKKFDEIWRNFGLIEVQKGKFTGCINPKGEVVIPIEYDGIFGYDPENKKRAYIKVVKLIDGKAERGKYEYDDNGKLIYISGSF